MSFPLGPFPASERLRFRLPSLGDAAFYQALMSDPDYLRFIADNGITSPEAAETFIRTKALARFAEQGVGLWVVDLKETGGAIGICGLVVRRELPCPDLGFAFLEAFRGKGYGEEAGRAVLEFVVRELKLRRLCAITSPDNIRSAALLKKLGFTAQGQRTLKEIGATSNFYEWSLRFVDIGLA